MTSFSNISATTTPFLLTPGSYGVTVSSASFNGGSVTLEIQSLDGTTFIPVLPPFSANGYQEILLPTGLYQLAVSGGATAVYAQIATDSPDTFLTDTIAPADSFSVQ